MAAPSHMVMGAFEPLNSIFIGAQSQCVARPLHILTFVHLTERARLLALCRAALALCCDHVASTRFSSGSFTAATFQNVTNINSTLIFCRATADEFNYSSNPTFRNSDGELIVIDPGDDTGQRTFSFVTTVGLYNSNNELLGVAKLSRPVEKNDEKDLTVRVRLDF